jgi:hypothetical protein
MENKLVMIVLLDLHRSQVILVDVPKARDLHRSLEKTEIKRLVGNLLRLDHLSYPTKTTLMSQMPC